MDFRTSLETVLLQGNSDVHLLDEVVIAAEAFFMEEAESAWEDEAAALEQRLEAGQGTLQPDFWDDSGCKRLRVKTLTQATGLPYAIFFPKLRDSLDVAFVDALDWLLLCQEKWLDGACADVASLAVLQQTLRQYAPDALAHFFQGDLKDIIRRVSTNYRKIFY